MRALLPAAAAITGSLDPREVIARILTGGMEVVSAERATLSSIADHQIQIEATIGRDGSLTWVGRRYPMSYIEDQPVVAAALRGGEIAFGGALDAERAAPEFREALSGVQHTAVMPLLDGSEVTGMLALSRYEDDPFGDDDRLALGLIQLFAGAALRNALLHEQVTRTQARLETAIAAAEDAGSQRELGALLGRLLVHACAAAEADGGSLARVEGNEIILEATTGDAPVPSRWPMAPMVREATRRGEAVQLSPEEYSGAPASLSTVLLPYRRFLTVPMLVQGEVVGLLAMGREAETEFSTESIRGVQQLASLARLMLRNARLLEQSRDVERRKSEFMNVVVHELRAPLGVSAGYLELVLDGTVGSIDDAAVKALRISHDNTLQASSIAEELLTVARLEGGMLPVRAERCDAAAAARAVVSRLAPRTESAGGRITVRVTGECWAYADRINLERILDNLLRNALTYGGRPPQVEVSARTAGGAVEMTVSDNGAGVIADDRDRIFARFVRGTDERARSTSGTGLGLYLSRELAHLMDGDLLLDEGDGGAVFRLILPRD